MTPPAALAGPALERWTLVAAELLKRGPVDTDRLLTYCQVWARWRQAEDGLAKSGQLVRKPNGGVGPSPLIAIAQSAGTQVRALERQLGIAGDQADDGGGDLLTRRELAERLSVHMLTITKWEKDGLPIAARGRKGKASTYREADARAWLAAREVAAKTSGLVDVAQERARKERAQAAVSEQTFQMRAGLLIPQEEVDKAWSAEVNASRQLALQCPAQYKDRVFHAATLNGLDGVERALKEMIVELLRELGNPHRLIVEA